MLNVATADTLHREKRRVYWLFEGEALGGIVKRNLGGGA